MEVAHLFAIVTLSEILIVGFGIPIVIAEAPILRIDVNSRQLALALISCICIAIHFIRRRLVLGYKYFNPDREFRAKIPPKS